MERSHKFNLVIVIGFFLSVAVLGIPATEANKHQTSKFLYTSQPSGTDEPKNYKTIVNYPDSQSTIAFTEQPTDYKKEIYLSPDRKAFAVTVESPEAYGQISTYITDVNGRRLTSLHLGSFVSWSPDSNTVLLFLADNQNVSGRAIYLLSKDDEYRNSALPVGTISADISPADGATAYSVTLAGTDQSELRIKMLEGADKTLIKDTNQTFAWLRWSPKGDKIAFLALNLGQPFPNRDLVIINLDGTTVRRISNIVWNYPPVWSPDGDHLVFARQDDNNPISNLNNFELLSSNLWEYSILKNSENKLTNFNNAKTIHPAYSTDGLEIIFISNESGSDQVWMKNKTDLYSLTNSDDLKSYPILP